MGVNDVGDETSFLERHRDSGHRLAEQDRLFQGVDIVVGGFRRFAAEVVDDFPHPGNLDFLAPGHEYDLIFGVGAELPGKMLVLAGEILMNKETFHWAEEI